MHSRSIFRAAFALLALGVATPVLGQALSADPVLKPDAPVDPHRPLAQELRASASPRLVVTVVGGMLLDGAPLPLDPQVQALLRAGELSVTIGMLETPLIDPAATVAYPEPRGEAPALKAPPTAAAALREQGFDAVTLASDHALDWGIAGLRSTIAALDRAGVVHAGAGDTASRAAHAAYYGAPGGGGRIAVVSTTTAFRPNSQALDQQGAAPGRAGVHGIELGIARQVSPEQLQVVQTAACRFKHLGDPAACAKLEPASEASLFYTGYRAGAQPDAYGTSAFELNVPQANAFLSGIREGKQNADLLVAAIHADQVIDARRDDAPAPAFLAELAHAAVAAGADLVMVSGRPVLGPVEIVASPSGTPAPVFYGLGQFAGASEGILVRSIAGASALRVEIQPLDHTEGQPRLATRQRAEDIVKRLQALSASYGTRIAIERHGDTAIGVISVSIGETPR